MSKTKQTHIRAVAVAVFLLLCLLITACHKGSSDSSDSGGGSETGGGATEPGETLYVPTVDEDADSLDGITIRSAEDLAKIGNDPAFPLDGDYYLVIDLDLSEIENWAPIGGAVGRSGAYYGDGVFSGTFDGRGHIIDGLTISEMGILTSAYYGLFGTVGSAEEDDPAVITNLTLKNVSVQLASNADTAVGALAGQVNGYAEVSNISLLSGSVQYSGNGNLGCASLIGQCRTDRAEGASNEGIEIFDIFSNLSVTSSNSGWDTGAGLIGRIRDSQLRTLSDIVFIGSTSSEGGGAMAIAGGDSSAVTLRKIYFLESSGYSRDDIGEALSEETMTGGKLKLSGAWTVAENMYPLLTSLTSRSNFSLLEFTSVEFASGDNIANVTRSFTLPSSALGQQFTWSSGNESVIKISGTTAEVTRPAGNNVNVKLTVTYGAGAGELVVCVLGDEPADTDSSAGGNTPSTQVPSDSTSKPNEVHPTGIYFVNERVKPGEAIEVAGGPASGTYTWTIENKLDNSSRTETTNKPSLSLTKDDAESLVTVSVSGFDPIVIYYSDLPVIYIDSDNDYYSVPMNYVSATLRVTGSDADSSYNGKTEIRVRGNSTATMPKRPFKIKLDKKANLLGIDSEGASKHWCLLANAKDPTLMRNKLLMDFAGAIGSDPHIGSENVILIYNGEYCGVYELSEHVRVGETRVDVFDWEEYAEDASKAIGKKLSSGSDASKIADKVEQKMLTDWSWMSSGSFTYEGKTYNFVKDLGLDPLPPETGGFLLEMDFYAFNKWNSIAGLFTSYSQPIYFNTPEPINLNSLDSFYTTPLYWYTYNYIQSFEYALHNEDFFYRDSDPHYRPSDTSKYNDFRTYDPVEYSCGDNDGKHYSELFDMDNLVKNFIFCEVAMNWDSMKNSFFIYKDTDGLAKIGPQWDFDWAWGNVLWNSATWEPEAWHTTCDNFMIEQYYQEEQWNRMLIRDPYFLTKVYEAWHELRDTEIKALVGNGGTIDSYASYIRRAALANDMRWAGEMSSISSYSGEYYSTTFEEEYGRMKDFVSTRMNWLDRQFESIDTLASSLGMYVSSPDKIGVPEYTVSGNTVTVKCSVTDPSVKYVSFQINGKTIVEAAVSGGTATATFNKSALESGAWNCIVANAKDANHKYIINEGASDPGNYSVPVSNYNSFKY